MMNPRIETTALSIYMNPKVLSSANKLRKLEFEYIGMTVCRVKIKPIMAIVYTIWFLFGVCVMEIIITDYNDGLQVID